MDLISRQKLLLFFYVDDVTSGCVEDSAFFSLVTVSEAASPEELGVSFASELAATNGTFSFAEELGAVATLTSCKLVPEGGGAPLKL